MIYGSLKTFVTDVVVTAPDVGDMGGLVTELGGIQAEARVKLTSEHTQLVEREHIEPSFSLDQVRVD